MKSVYVNSPLNKSHQLRLAVPGDGLPYYGRQQSKAAPDEEMDIVPERMASTGAK